MRKLLRIAKEKVIRDMYDKHKLTYDHPDDQEKFINNKFVFNCNTYEPKNKRDIPVDMLDIIPYTRQTVLDSIYNNFEYRGCMTEVLHNNPDILSDRLYKTMTELAAYAPFFEYITESNVKVIPFDLLLNMMLVDCTKNITIQTYDPSNRLLIDFPKDYSDSNSLEYLANEVSYETSGNMADTDMNMDM